MMPKHHPSCSIMCEDVPLSSLYLLSWLCHLRKGRETVKVLGNVRIVNSAVVFRHFQGAVSQQLLEHKCIAAAIDKIFPGEGMAI